MTIGSRIRSAITGRFVDTNEADAHPDSTVRETYGDANRRVELEVAADAVILGAGFPVNGRVEVNQGDLNRLKEARGFEPGQP